MTTPSSSGGVTDYRATRTGRRRSWYGLKKHAKAFLALRIPHAVLRMLVRIRPSLRRDGRLPAPARLKEVEGEAGGVRFVMLRPDRCIVAKELYWGAGRRPRPEDDNAVALFAALARRADVMLDIGAYTGLFTLVGTKVNPYLRAHAFEIVPDVCRALHENCVRNGVLDRVVLHNEGIGAPDAAMVVPSDSVGSALPDFYSSRLHFETGTRVPFRALDSMIGSIPAGSRVLLKIDVEGTENEVFRHGQAFLAAFRPSILCEVLHGVADGSELEPLLAPHGYRFYLVRGDDLLPANGIEPHPLFRDWLFMTLPPDEVAELLPGRSASRP